MLTISIIIPVYKVEAYIEECLASVVAQSDAKANIECIIVDDCSPDGSMDIVRRFVDNYQGAVQFRLLRHEVNRGLSAARNTGIDAATGDYLLFVDSDDYLSADCLSTLVSGFDLCPGADVVQANNLWGVGLKSLWYHTSRPYVLTGGQACMEPLLFHRIPILAWNKLVNRQFVLSHQRVFLSGGLSVLRGGAARQRDGESPLLQHLPADRHRLGSGLCDQRQYDYRRQQGPAQRP